MVSVNSSITAASYNGVRTATTDILQTQWNQTPLSSLATGYKSVGLNATPVNIENIERLYIDLQKVVVHQTGSLDNTVSVPVVGHSIAADTSQDYNQDTGDFSDITDGNEMGINDYILASTNIGNFDPQSSGFPVENFALGSALTNQRTTGWGGSSQVQSIYHIVNFTFGSTAHIESFFAAGGRIRFQASITDSSSGTKNSNWNSMLDSMGFVYFGKYKTTASSGTIPSSSGYDTLTTDYRTVITKTGSGVYSDNSYKIDIKMLDSLTIRARITFNDGDVGTDVSFPVDESVVGTVNSSINHLRPSSTFAYNNQAHGVNIPAPATSTHYDLSSNSGSVPE